MGDDLRPIRRREDLPPLERAVSDALDELNCRHYGRVSGWVYPVEFLEFLGEEGHTVTPTTELTELRAEVARLRAGESSDPAPEGAQLTPAQWIHRWNQATANERLAKVEQIFNDSDTATRCRYQDHGSALHELANAQQSINRIRELHRPTDVEFSRGPRRDQGETGDVRYLRKCCSHCEVEGMSVPADWPCDTVRALDGEAP